MQIGSSDSYTNTHTTFPTFFILNLQAYRHMVFMIFMFINWFIMYLCITKYVRVTMYISIGYKDSIFCLH